ncbi:MAG TPA: RdgB/HAM1 family non-canonical purine NTP pyrophosphatase [Oscillospiraceae bacterium]|nr:RdgB/HAM1 family non-canonical purine NTP pyrophosphatase [Oscillospiraceae bacterium]HPF57092.1 RdgB/HAM1 family non-canonical purine NTP pyrophosphatase [Clostridiales bacterium]HPK36524.1 RdgB/HAM1 family non-canonical purine NTP pyrophosphatase [Oscillospiraceae bacterium]HPR76878.1 RdgB/HAM1 family non-canonical purine NTP pyrophosphatase [Oscillospiraceae bacterium]
MKIILATGNPGKAREFADLFGAYDIEITLPVSMPDVDENGETFAENARIKAKALYDICGETVLADDSGLCVDALDGRPGIYSARYAQPGKRRMKVLGELKDVAPKHRTARFVCTLCLIEKGGKITECAGTCEGHITDRSRGTSGFGYDPIFQPDGYSETFAELTQNVKNQISHRADAVRKLMKLLGAQQ